ncbi:MAG: oligosaccharide flippase family protein [Actinomycetota bacterium]
MQLRVPRRRDPSTAIGGALRTSVTGGAVGKAIELVTLVALAVVVPRVLGPSDYGRFAVALTVVTLGSLALTLGGHTMMARYVPAVPEPDRVAVARELGRRLARSRSPLVLAAVLAVSVAAIAAPDTVEPPLAAMVAVALVLNVVTTLLLQVGLGLGRTGLWSARFPFQNAVLVIAVVALYPSLGLDGAVAGLVIASTATLVVAAQAVWPMLSIRPGGPAAVPDGALRFGTLQAGGAALTQLTHRGGVLAVALLGGSTVETGHAALAVGVALGATYAILQLFTVALPHLSEEDHGRDDAEALLRRLASVLLAVVVPGTLLVAATSSTVIPAVFGDDFSGAASAFGPALGVVVLAPVSSLLVQASAIRLQPAVAFVSGIVSAAAFLIVAVLAVPAWDAVGGTVATLTGVVGGTAVAAVRMPGAASGRLLVVSFAAAAAVTAVGAAA